MQPRLERLRDELRGRLNQFAAATTAPDEVIDDCLHLGLQALLTCFPPVTSVVTIVADGATQDVRALLRDRLYTLLQVIYPWDPPRVRQVGWPYFNIGAGLILFRGVTPQVDDQMRVEYRHAYTIAGLRGAPDDDLPTAYEEAVLLAAGAQFLHRQARQPNADKLLAGLAVTWEEQARTNVYDQRPVYENPAWGALGL